MVALGSAYANEAVPGRAMVTMEGATHDLDPLDTVASTVTIDEKGMLFYVAAADHPVSINFNLFDRSVLDQLPVALRLPEDNSPNIRFELSFFNADRESGGLQRRIIFSEGVINVQEIGEKALRLDFEGNGHPLMDTKTFSIEGMIDIQFK